MNYGWGVALAFASMPAWSADAAPGAMMMTSQDFVRSQATSKRCDRKLPGLKPQMAQARAQWLSTLDASQLQAAQSYADGKEGRKLAKAADTEAFLAFDRNILSAAFTCIGMLKGYGAGPYPQPTGTAMAADKVKWHLDNFAPMVLSSLKCARLDAIDVAQAANGAETWTYRGCGRIETVPMVQDGGVLSMDNPTADRLFATMTD